MITIGLWIDDIVERNVDCLLLRSSMRHNDVDCIRPGKWNVLAKMDTLLMQMIEWEDPTFGGNNEGCGRRRSNKNPTT